MTRISKAKLTTRFGLDRRAFIGTGIASAAGYSLLPLSAVALGGYQDDADPWLYAADLRKRIQEPSFPDREVLVTDHGAVGDGETECTAAINNAVKVCAAGGGGRVVIPEGIYRTGAIHLLSNVNLHVSEDATLAFYSEPEKYLPVVFTRYEGTECMNYSPLIYAFEQENIAVTGKGTLDGGTGLENWMKMKGGKYGNPPGNASEERLRAMAEAGVPVEERIFGTGERLRPNFIQPYRCKKVLIEDIRIRRAPMWQIHPVLCEHVVVRGVDINSHFANNDGCNPEASRYVLIENCFFDTGDDCIAIKAGRNADGRRIGVPSQDILVSNCQMKAGHGGVVIGSEMSGGVCNVFAENCQMSSPDLWFMLRIKTNSLRGGFVENIHVRKIEVGTIGRAAIRINFHYSDGDIGEHVPRVSNVTVSDVTGTDIRQVLDLRGYERSPVTDVRISDCRFEGVQVADRVEHVEGLVLDRVHSSFKG